MACGWTVDACQLERAHRGMFGACPASRVSGIITVWL
jgi:hypothetical protein